jgi:putative membrane protein
MSHANLSDTLAAERTLLAWIRTGLALMGFGFVVARFGIFLQQIQFIRNDINERPLGASLWFGTVLIFAGVIVNIYASWQHIWLIRRLERGETSTGRSLTGPVLIALFLAIVGVAMAIYLISVRQSSGVSALKLLPGTPN